MNTNRSRTSATRVLGRSGITVSALGAGCWAIGGPFWAQGAPHGWGEVDLWQFHLNDHPLAEAAAIRDACEDLVTEGLIRGYGWSTDFPERAELFAAGRHCCSVQLALNVFEDNPTVLAVADHQDLAAIARGPLAMGLLTGSYRTRTLVDDADVRARSPRTVPIPGFRTVAQVTENAGAMAHGPLTRDQLAEIDRLLQRSPVLP